jgi:hypothetical protein
MGGVHKDRKEVDVGLAWRSSAKGVGSAEGGDMGTGGGAGLQWRCRGWTGVQREHSGEVGTGQGRRGGVEDMS